MFEMLDNPIVKGALAGALGAAAVDIAAFRSWKSHEEAAAYSWGTAAWRWFQGAALGALSAAGIEAAV